MAVRVFELYGDVELRNVKLKRGVRDADREFQQFESKAKAHVRSIESSLSNLGSGLKQGFLSSAGIFPMAGGGGIGGFFGQLAGMGLGTIVGGIKDAAVNVTQMGLAFNDLKENSTIAFTVLLKDGAKALQLFDQLAEYSRKSPIFKTDQLVTAAQMFMPRFGGGKELFEALSGAGAVTAVTGHLEWFEPIAKAFNDMATKAKAQAEDINQQLAERGVDAWGLAARALGMTPAQVQESVTAGRFGGKGFATVILQQANREYGEIVEMMNKTRVGKQAQVDDTFQQLAARSTIGLHTTWKGGLDRQRQIMESPRAVAIADQIGGVSNMIGGHLLGALDSIIDGSLFQAIPQGVKKGVDAGKAEVKSTITGMANNEIIQTFKDALGIKSPSKVFVGFGVNIMQGLRDGFLAGKDKAQIGLENTFRKILSSDTLMPLIREAAQKFNLPVELIAAVMAKESAGRSRAVSPAGASGLMQLMPATARRHGVTDIFDPRQNVMGGAAELAQLMARFKGNIPEVLAHYNWSGKGRMPAETVDYVKRTFALLGGTSPSTGMASLGNLNTSIGELEKDAARYQQIVLNFFEHVNRLRSKLGYKEISGEAPLMWDGHKVVRGHVPRDGYLPPAVPPGGREDAQKKQIENDLKNAEAAYISAVINNTRTQEELGKLYKQRQEAEQRAAALANGQKQTGLLGLMEQMATGQFKSIEDIKLTEVTKELLVLPTRWKEIGNAMSMADAAMLGTTISSDDLTKAVKNLGNSSTATAEQIAESRRIATEGIEPKKKKDKVFDKQFTREGVAGDFQYNLQSFFANIGSEKPGSLAKQFGLSLLKDIQNRIGHDISASITEAIFGSRNGETNKLSGGLFGGGGKGGFLGGIFSTVIGSIFGGLFGGGGGSWGKMGGKIGFPGLPPNAGIPGRASGGPVSSLHPYIVGEAGPELFIPRTSGEIIPNHAARRGSVIINRTTNNFNITMRPRQTFRQRRTQRETVERFAAFAQA